MEAWAFDFDYTLGDTTGGILECIAYGLGTLGFPAPEREAMRATIGLSLDRTLFELTGCDGEREAREFTRLFMERADEVMVASASLYPQTVPLLRALREEGVRTAVVTTKAAFRIRGIFEKFGVPDLVDVIVGSDMVKNEKPHPEALLTALRMLHTAPENAIYIGDSAVDARCAMDAGVPFAGVLTGTAARRDLEAFPHLAVVRDLAELERVRKSRRWDRGTR